jgi:hypothetical protein
MFYFDHDATRACYCFGRLVHQKIIIIPTLQCGMFTTRDGLVSSKSIARTRVACQRRFTVYAKDIANKVRTVANIVRTVEPINNERNPQPEAEQFMTALPNIAPSATAPLHHRRAPS